MNVDFLLFIYCLSIEKKSYNSEINFLQKNFVLILMTFRIIFGLPQSFACLLLYVTFFDSIYSIYLLIQFFINYEEKIFTRYILIMS